MPNNIYNQKYEHISLKINSHLVYIYIILSLFKFFDNKKYLMTSTLIIYYSMSND